MDLFRLTIPMTSLTTASDSQLRAFACDHMQRLMQTSHCDERYAQMFQETKMCYEACFGTMRRQVVVANDALVALKKSMSDAETAIHVAFGRDSATYQAFFPHGILPYHQATLTTAGACFLPFVQLAQLHQATLGIAFVTRFDDLLKAFLDARATQRAQKGRGDAMKVISREKRVRLERQLWKNVLLLAAEHVDDGSGLAIYCDVSQIKSQKNKILSQSATK
jgi:hypothetical protein